MIKRVWEAIKKKLGSKEIKHVTRTGVAASRRPGGDPGVARVPRRRRVTTGAWMEANLFPKKLRAWGHQ